MTIHAPIAMNRRTAKPTMMPTKRIKLYRICFKSFIELFRVVLRSYFKSKLCIRYSLRRLWVLYLLLSLEVILKHAKRIRKTPTNPIAKIAQNPIIIFKTPQTSLNMHPTTVQGISQSGGIQATRAKPKTIQMISRLLKQKVCNSFLHFCNLIDGLYLVMNSLRLIIIFIFRRHDDGFCSFVDHEDEQEEGEEEYTDWYFQ